jgi:hypothetical protein
MRQIMNIEELKLKLTNECIGNNIYNFVNEFPNDEFCMNKLHGVWDVYYSEKGEKNSLKSFDNENDACTYLYLLIKESMSH